MSYLAWQNCYLFHHKECGPSTLGNKLWPLIGEIVPSKGMTLMCVVSRHSIVMYFIPPYYQPPVTITGTIIALIFTFGGRYQLSSHFRS